MTSSSLQAGPILEIEKATVYRRATCVFEDFSFSLKEGKHTAILGPNGSGKSTLLKLLSAEVHPVPNDATRMRLFGEGSSKWVVSSPSWTQHTALTLFILHPTQHETSGLRRLAEL
jgi:ABC-type molybdenum transport system ATPase subunit/photorepair protein PhrA